MNAADQRKAIRAAYRHYKKHGPMINNKIIPHEETHAEFFAQDTIHIIHHELGVIAIYSAEVLSVLGVRVMFVWQRRHSAVGPLADFHAADFESLHCPPPY